MRGCPGLGLASDAVCQELVRRQLAAHLLETVKALSVLDAGCGQGTQAVELARLAHHVVDVDLAETLLDAAGSAATDEPGEVRQRLNSSWSVIFWPWQPCGLE